MADIAYRRIAVKQGIASVDGKITRFVDRTSEAFDVLIAATGYRIDLDFVAPQILDVADNRDSGLPVDVRMGHLYQNEGRGEIALGVGQWHLFAAVRDDHRRQEGGRDHGQADGVPADRYWLFHIQQEQNRLHVDRWAVVPKWPHPNQ